MPVLQVKNAVGHSRKDCIWTFKHQYFRSGQPGGLAKIVRKLSRSELKRMQSQSEVAADDDYASPTLRSLKVEPQDES
jgi:hypothetical protein